MRRALVSLLVLTALAGCGGSEPTQTLTVLAAASLKEPFTELERMFEAGHAGVDVRISFAGSSDLAQQIVNGAPADVFAAANESTMDTVVQAGLAAGEPKIFAGNTLQIVTAPGNPKQITGFADLAGRDLVLVVCAPQVPCGSATGQIEQQTGVTLAPASEEPDVKAVLGKVAGGEADAGLVYVTDVKAAGDKVTGVDFPEAANAVNRYPIIALDGSGELAAQFVTLVLGEGGGEVLASAGFQAPSPPDP
ncbi:MAG TPA: molybdate ABC transporter substrate-binding protein [Pseudonocardiaceae bacterium]|nr:molybdate ABC transporter substrate-binding protein [Pseudonocardiaceae bacterium]